MQTLRFLVAVLFAACSVSPLASADGGGASGGGSWSNSPLAPYHELIENEKYQAAIDQLQQALADSPDNADLLNLTAYSQRKLGRYDEALTNYLKALEIDPEHLGANEYLGELYLQMGQLDKALERLAVLDKECFFGCEEYDDLEEAIEAYRAKNP